MSTGVSIRARTWTRLVLELPQALIMALLVTAIGAGCTRANPAYRGPAGPADGGASDAGGDTAPGDTADSGNDGRADQRIDVTADTADTRADAADSGLACVTASDCSARGAPVCGTWECRNNACVVNCPNCTDGDGDGFGIGPGCVGPDCDDADPNVQASGQRSCPGVGVTQGSCRAGSQSCTNGVWTTCTGQVGPTAEACNDEDDDCNGTADDGLPAFVCGLGACQNSVPACSAGALATCVPHSPTNNVAMDITCDGVDDDCDGLIDEDCPAVISACIHVSPAGRDNGNPTGAIDKPFLTIPAAVAYAVLNSVKTVCVAGGPTCDDRTTYTLPSTAPFDMANGVSVYGNYESTNWKRCPLSATAPDPTVTLTLGDATGVRFPTGITTPTTLDGFVLQRGTFDTVSGVTVAGAKQVTLSNLIINDAPPASHSYGINLVGGGRGADHPLSDRRRRGNVRYVRRALGRVEADDPRELRARSPPPDAAPPDAAPRRRPAWASPGGSARRQPASAPPCCSTARRAPRSRPAPSAASRAPRRSAFTSPATPPGR